MTAEQADLFDAPPQDITARRHGRNPESMEAFAGVQDKLPEARAKVLEEIRGAGVRGMTCKELAAEWGVGMNTVSGRFSELKRDGLIVPRYGEDGRPMKREGSTVYIAASK